MIWFIRAARWLAFIGLMVLVAWLSIRAGMVAHASLFGAVAGFLVGLYGALLQVEHQGP